MAKGTSKPADRDGRTGRIGRAGRRRGGARCRASRLSRKVYERELAGLQVELARLQEWVHARGLRVVVLFEGRDAAGKGGAIKTLTLAPEPADRAGGGPPGAD